MPEELPDTPPQDAPSLAPVVLTGRQRRVVELALDELLFRPRGLALQERRHGVEIRDGDADVIEASCVT